MYLEQGSTRAGNKTKSV